MESTPEQASEGRALVTVLACVLEKLIQANANSGVRRREKESMLIFFYDGASAQEFIDFSAVFIRTYIWYTESSACFSVCFLVCRCCCWICLGFCSCPRCDVMLLLQWFSLVYDTYIRFLKVVCGTQC